MRGPAPYLPDRLPAGPWFLVRVSKGTRRVLGREARDRKVSIGRAAELAVELAFLRLKRRTPSGLGARVRAMVAKGKNPKR